MSSSRYHMLPQARDDVIAIAKHIGRDSPAAADRFLDALETTCERIVDLPRSGVKRTFNKSAIHRMRMMPVEGFRTYLVFYQPSGNAIAIVRVIHGARDLPTIFSDDK